MLEIPYRVIIPYPFQVVLEQYFDLEHISHVHPTTLGDCTLVERSVERIVYDQIWPADGRGRRATSRVVQTYTPPGDIWFEFIAGKHKGTKVHSRLASHQDGTEVNETYYVPWVPNWGILRWLIAPLVYRQVDRIWKEDLDVGVCIGGWPGVPGMKGMHEDALPRRPGAGRHFVGKVTAFPPSSLTLVDVEGTPILVVHSAAGLRALEPKCPHTQGTLERGRLDGNCIVCPWHGARFDTERGKALSGPTQVALATYIVHIEGDEVFVEVAVG